MGMPDTNAKNLENTKLNETHKRRSFFWWEINAKTKDLLDFRYNTQEEIDKLNDEMTTTSDLDEIIQQRNSYENNKNIDNENEENLREKDEIKAESDLEWNLESIDEPVNNYKEEAIEWEVVEDLDKDEKEPKEENTNEEKKVNEPKDITEEKVEEKTEDKDEETQETENEIKENDDEPEKNENEVEESELWDSAKFFDPFELNFDKENEEDEELPEWNTEMFNPFELNEEENDEIDENRSENDEEISDNEDKEKPLEEKISDGIENNEEENDEIENENEEVEDENDENENENYETEDENDKSENENYESEDENDESEDENDTVINSQIPVNPNQNSEKKETIKEKKIKKNSATGEIISEEEIELEQWQDIPDTESDEEYQPTDEEIFEQEPEFFANDEISQQFMHLVQNLRGIFKLERKDWEQNPYFKILGWKTENSTLEYLFYLIEEEGEPIDLYIKKVETNQENEDENEHLVQFSYNEDKELSIFVDEIILYEKINKSEPNTIEYNDTKAIFEKFIFLTDNHYDKLKSQLDKQREEKQKKKQLQQIFKGF